MRTGRLHHPHRPRQQRRTHGHVRQPADGRFKLPRRLGSEERVGFELKTVREHDHGTEAGMVASNERGNKYDRFRERLMFPIMDRRGRVIAFGGRVLGPTRSSSASGTIRTRAMSEKKPDPEQESKRGPFGSVVSARSVHLNCGD